MTRIVAGMIVLAVATAVGAQPSTVELRATGEHRMASGDTPELARQLALIDARRQLLRTAIARLSTNADIKSLGLTPAQFAAYTPAVLEIEELPAPKPQRTEVRAEVRTRLNATDLARRLAGVRRDQDTAGELTDAWGDLQALDQQLADQTRRRASASAAESARIAAEQTLTVTAIQVRQLTARAYAALARTEPTTVGGRATSADGRDRARQLADAALTLAPESSAAHYLQGDLMVDAELPQAAEAEYRMALDAAPPTSAGRTKLAAALRFQGKFPEAVTELREALRLDPTFAQAHSDLGLVLRAQRSVPDAIAAYREAIRLAPDLIDAHNGLAVALANSGNLEGAVAEFREIIRIDPDSTIGYYNLAYALADLDRDVESAAALREVIRINPDHYNARFNLGELFRLESKFDDALIQFREYLRLAPDTPQNQRNINRARGYVKQFEN